MTRGVALLAALLLTSCVGPGGGSGSGPGPGGRGEPPGEPRSFAPPARPNAPVPPALAAAARAAAAQVQAHLVSGDAARRDGDLYSLDVATLLLYAARRHDAVLYDALRPAADALIVRNPEDPYTKGFVLVRTRPGARPHRSGAAEALWLARALWTGAQAFGRGSDRELALAILDGYAEHTYVLQDVWLARRAFDFPTRSFVSLSVPSAYQPDFLADVERQKPRASFRGFAERSYRLLERSATPGGLLLPMIQPEVGAGYPGAGLDLHAPNGLAPLEESCLGAEGAVGGLPQLSGRLLEFAVSRAPRDRLRAWYRVDGGAAAGETPLAPAGLACLVRIASALDDRAALDVLDPELAAELRTVARARTLPAPAGALLLAAQARGAL